MKKILFSFILLYLLPSGSYAEKLIFKNTDSTEVNNGIEKYYDSGVNDPLLIELCGTIRVKDSIELKSNTTVTSCGEDKSRATLMVVRGGNIEYKKGYNKAVFRLKHASKINKKSNLNYNFHNIFIQNLTIDGNYDANKLKLTLGVSFTSHEDPSVINNTSMYNINITDNNIMNFHGGGIFIGVGTLKYFSNRFIIGKLDISRNHVKKLEKAGAGIYVQSLRGKNVGNFALNTFQIYSVTLKDNIVFDVWDEEEKDNDGNQVNPPKLAAGFGILIVGAKHVELDLNKVSYFAEEAIRVNDSYNVVVQRSKVSSSGHDEFAAGGIKLNMVLLGEITDNELYDLDGPGIELLSASDVNVTNNVIGNPNVSNDIRSHAIRMQSTGFLNKNIQFKDNTISNLIVGGCRAAGITPILREHKIESWNGSRYVNYMDFIYHCGRFPT